MDVKDLNALIPLKPGQVRGAARTDPVDHDMTVGELREALKDFPNDLRIGFKIGPAAKCFHPIRAAHLKAVSRYLLANLGIVHIAKAQQDDERVVVLMEFDTPSIPEKKKHA